MKKLHEKNSEFRGSTGDSTAATARIMEHIRGILASPDFDKVSTPEVILSFYALILDKLMETLDAYDIPKEVW